MIAKGVNQRNKVQILGGPAAVIGDGMGNHGEILPKGRPSGHCTLKVWEGRFPECRAIREPEDRSYPVLLVTSFTGEGVYFRWLKAKTPPEGSL
jgi:hypothetical protein